MVLKISAYCSLSSCMCVCLCVCLFLWVLVSLFAFSSRVSTWSLGCSHLFPQSLSFSVCYIWVCQILSSASQAAHFGHGWTGLLTKAFLPRPPRHPVCFNFAHFILSPVCVCTCVYVCVCCSVCVLLCILWSLSYLAVGVKDMHKWLTFSSFPPILWLPSITLFTFL